MSACNDVYTVNDRFMGFFKNHFVHAMQYYFHLVSKSHDENSTIFLIGRYPSTNSGSRYAIDFIERIKRSNRYGNIGFRECSMDSVPKGMKCIPLHCGADPVKCPWFTSLSGARFMRDALIRPAAIRRKATIGIINRTRLNHKGHARNKGNRRLLNSGEVTKTIRTRTGTTVDEIHFDDKSFNQQINFCNSHDIIISPHGAQICSIPFMPDYGIVIEICNEEYYLPTYFKQLALQSGKGHLLYCRTHDPVQLKKSVKDRNRSERRAIDITVDVDRLVGAVLNALRDRDAKIRKGNVDDLLDRKI